MPKKIKPTRMSLKRMTQLQSAEAGRYWKGTLAIVVNEMFRERLRRRLRWRFVLAPVFFFWRSERDKFDRVTNGQMQFAATLNDSAQFYLMPPEQQAQAALAQPPAA